MDMHSRRACSTGGARPILAAPPLPSSRATTRLRSSKDLQQLLPTVEGRPVLGEQQQGAAYEWDASPIIPARHKHPSSVLERIQKQSERDERSRKRQPQTIPVEMLPRVGAGRRDAASWRQSHSKSQTQLSLSSNSQRPMKRRRHDGMALVRLTALVPAGKSAGVIAHTLRDEQVRLHCCAGIH
eukprot:1139395-Pelagomonas_calceolata.AAC.4